MAARIRTRFTEMLGLENPIALAPMDKVSDGRLAAAVSRAGGLGLIGGGYGDAGWLDAAYRDAGNAPIGVGLITWSVTGQPDLVEATLARKPRALMVSFGDAEPIVARAKDAGVPVLWQVQTLAQARQALDAGVDVIVAQGSEAGGHGMSRGLMTLLPAVRDMAGDKQIILGAGGIADGRGLAAVLMLGGDGVLVGTRFWASQEANGPEVAKARMLSAGGDDTIRTKVFDAVRELPWADYFTGRVLRNTFYASVSGDPTRIGATERAAYATVADDDFDTRALIAGEALDLIHDLPPAAEIVDRIIDEAVVYLARSTDFTRQDTTP